MRRLTPVVVMDFAPQRTVFRSNKEAGRTGEGEQIYTNLESSACQSPSLAVCLSNRRARNAMGVVGPRWVPRSSKPAAGRDAGRGGFDSHPLPLPPREEPHNRLPGEEGIRLIPG